ncbi:MAG: HYR domain-containing protein [Phycisphaerae bacterium]|nr:HYR domain-containing protein [Phycisphaerae bacterium]
MNWKKTLCFLGVVLLCTSAVTATDITPAGVSRANLQSDEGHRLPADQGKEDPNDSLRLDGADACPAADLGTLSGNGSTSDATGTCGMTNDYENDGSPCNYYGSGSPDVIYQFQVDTDGNWTFDLCGETWDTSLMIREETGGGCPGVWLACNGDSCGVQSQVTVTLATGTTYYVIVDGYGSGDCGTFTLNWTAPVGCPADTCGTALPVTTLPFNDTGNTCSCNNDYQTDGTCPYTDTGLGPDLVYVYTPAANDTVDISLCNSSYDTSLLVYENACVDPLYACADDECGTQSEILNLSLTGGNTYYFVVDGYGSSCGDYEIDIALSAAPTPGDNCGDPFIIDLNTVPLPFSDSNSTCGRVDDYNATCLGDYDDGEDMIYELIVPSDICLDITATGSWIGLAIDSVCPPGDPCIAFDGGSSSASLHVNLTAGTYYIMVDTWPSPDCTAFDLTIDECPPPPECPPDSLFAQLPIDPSGSWIFITSDVHLGYIVYENYCVDGEICDIHWWGIDLMHSGGWIECDDDPVVFDIIFYPDDGTGHPDIANPVCVYTETLSPVHTGIFYGGAYQLKYYSVPVLSPCCTLRQGWVSIQDVDGDTCSFMWAGSEDGDLFSYQDTDVNDVDLAICLTGPSIPYSGACCHQNGTCTEPTTECECVNAGGIFQGDGTDCASVTCIGWYCDASAGDYEYIDRVEVGSIDNDPLGTGYSPGGYGDYTALSTTMEVGGSYDITITLGSPYSSDLGGLWIDWNRDYDFDDAGEFIALAGSPGYGPYTATIIPPWGAAVGDTRLRVRIQDGSFDPTLEPCGATDYGEVEDYTINVIPGPTVLTLEPDDTCLEIGVDTLTVDIVLTTGASEEILGGGFYLAFDNTALSFFSISPGDPPFTEVVHEVVGADTIDYAVGIPTTEPNGYMDVGPITMASIVFTVLDENCDLADAVTFRDPGFPFETRLAKAVPGGGSAPLVPDDLLDLTNITIDWQAPVLTVPADVSVQCIEDADPGLLYGVATTGGIAIYYNDNGLGENPANQAYLKTQYSATNLNGSEFHFDTTPLTGIPGTSFNDLYSGLTPPATQFGYDIVLPAPTADGTVIPPPVIAYDYDGAGPSNPMPVIWAMDDYKPGGAANPAAIVYNSIVRSPSPGDIATDVLITRLDWEQSGTIYTSNIAGVLLSDGIHHWYTPSTPHSPMSNFGLSGVFYFSGTLTYDSSSDPDPLMDFYEGPITVVANYRSSETGVATAVDNCTLFPLIAYSDVVGGGTGCPGDPITITRTWTATDDCGNFSTGDQTITVEDTTPPEFVACPEDITVNNDPGLCSAVVTWTPPTAWDNCDGYLTPTGSHTPGDVFPVGTTTVTYNVSDSCGNDAIECSFDVTVIDNEPPVVTCPADITQNNDPGVCEASVTFAATATDNCSYTIKYEIESDPIGNPGVFDLEITSPYSFPVGMTTVLVTATDPAGLTDTCTFTVTINDTEAPVISGCPSDITVNNDPNLCSAVVTWTPPTAWDNCDGALTPTGTHNPGDVFPVGVTTVTYTVSDAAGNPAIPCVFTVTVIDAEAPVISGCPSDITVNNDPGLCSAVVTWTPPTAWDNCDGALTPTGTHNPGDVFPVGVTTVTYTVSDSAGNPAIPCVFTVTVIDNELPTITCPPDVTVNADPGVCYATGVDLGTPTVGDNCGIEPGYPINDAPAQFPVGDTIVTWTVRDVNGNENTCQQTVTVLGYNDFVVDIEIQGGVVGPFTRCISFTFFDCDGTDVTFEKDIDFVPVAGNALATGVVIVDELLCGDYDCVTAQDELHTLTVNLDRGGDFDIVGDHYEADFTGPNMLLQGDYYDDFADGYPVDFIDIVDFGVYFGQWGSVYDSDGDTIPDGNTPCGVFAIHADADGDGVIDVSDFAFITSNYGIVGDLDCCAPKASTPTPRTSITVRELASLGVPNAQRGDLNHDGAIDFDDVELFLTGTVPTDDLSGLSSESVETDELNGSNSLNVRPSRR